MTCTGTGSCNQGCAECRDGCTKLIQTNSDGTSQHDETAGWITDLLIVFAAFSVLLVIFFLVPMAIGYWSSTT